MYSRFKALQNFGEEELDNLKDSKVAVVGLGATGSVIAEHLARHGANLLLIDRDYLEENDCYSSNIYTPRHCRNSKPKAKVADEYLSNFTETEAHVESLDSRNIQLLSSTDLVMDGSDNLETRFLINSFCQKNNLPWIYTAAIGEKGYSMFFDEKCFNCVFEQIEAGSLETCESTGILREVSSTMASISSMKAVKYLAGKEVDEDLETFEGESFEVAKSGCKVCRGREYPHLKKEKEVTSVCGEKKYQLDKEIEDGAADRLKEQADRFTENDYLVRAEIDGRNLTLFSSGRAIIEAEDEGHAEAIYSEIIGV